MNKIAAALVILASAFLITKCQNGLIGLDGPDVMEASEAYGEISDAFVLKYFECRQKGFAYPTYSPTGVGIAACNDPSETRQQYVYTRSVHYCLIVVANEPCPPSGVLLDLWTRHVLYRCDLSDVYFLNAKKPLQGKVLWLPGGLDAPRTGCL